MKSILRLLSLFAVFLLLSGSYFSFAIKSGEPWLQCLVISILFGAFLVLGVLAVRNLLLEYRDHRILKAAERGARPADGKRSAVLGPVTPVGEPLRAPFSGEPCVAYEYRIFHIEPSTKGSATVFDFEGWASVPSEVTTAFGKVGLLGPLDLNNFSRHQRMDYGNANRYVRETVFQRSSLREVFKIKEYLDAAERDTAGPIREDIRHSEAREASGLTLEEGLIPVGSRIFAVGRFSRRLNGLVRTSGLGLRLLPGSAGGAAKGMTTGFQVLLATSLLGFAALMLLLNPATRDIPGVLLEQLKKILIR